MLTVQDEIHNIRRVPRPVEVEERVPDALLLQTFQVAAVEAAQLRLLVRDVLDQVEFTPGIVLKRHIVLGVYGFHFTLSLRVTQEGTDEELGEAVQGLLISLVRALEVVVRVRQRRERVVVAAIVADELRVLVLGRVLLGAHEEHVLEEVSSAVERLRVKRAAHVHVQGGAALVSLIVRDQQTFHLILELDGLVLALVAAGSHNFSVCLHFVFFLFWCVLFCALREDTKRCFVSLVFKL